MALKEEKVFVISGKKKANVRRETSSVFDMRVTIVHNINRTRMPLTHFPKDPICDIFLKTKLTRASCRRRAGTVVPKAEKFW